MEEATRVADNLYLGPLAVARDLPTLQRLQISAIVCAAAEGRAHFPACMDYLEMPHMAEHSCDIKDIVHVLDDVWAFCSRRMALGQNILVHCVHGRTRSASIATYILARQKPGCSVREAYAVVRSKRDVLVPESWLEALEVELQRANKQQSY